MTKYRKHEVFFVSVPPMGYLLNIFLPHRFSMVIWDVYPDVFQITGMKQDHPVYRIWSWLNRKSFKKAYRLFTISEKMAELLHQYVDPAKVIVQPIWSIFQENEKVSKADNPFIKALIVSLSSRLTSIILDIFVGSNPAVARSSATIATRS